ncbi:unnamed protein product [Victoria cruziana]
MEGSGRGGGRTFRYDFSREGESRLKEEVEAKLLEFTGYTDDVLADYVIVLVKNGKRKELAEQDLNVFLGDNCSSFVSWLWDHLSLNWHLYVKPQESSLPAEAVPTKHSLVECVKGNDVKLEDQNVSSLVDAEPMQERSMTKAGTRRKRQWNGLTREKLGSPLLRISEFGNCHLQDHSACSSKSNVEKGHSHYKEHSEKVQKETPPDSRKVATDMKIDAPRRLLQSAFREALGPLKASDSCRSELAFKRLRSVVSSYSSRDKFSQAKVNRSASRMVVSMATAMKAAIESAYDTSKARTVQNVLDGMGHGRHTVGAGRAMRIGSPHSKGPYSDYDRSSDGGLGPVHESGQPDTFQFNAYHSEAVLNLDRDEAMSGCASDHDAYDDADRERQKFMDTNETSYSENKDGNSLMVQYTVSPKADEVPKRTRLKDQPDAMMPKPSHKIVNISVNVSTWKPPHFASDNQVSKIGENTSSHDRGAFAFKSGVRLVQEIETVKGDRSERPHVDVHEEHTIVTSIPGSYSAGRPLDDVESRSIFVSNVHFGATKDLLSTHFNKFGEVQKVMIVMDATTGQPTGSAYVEFVRKESAELALALNGTSFLSRILKVVPRSSVTPRDAPVMSWSRLPRASPYSCRLPLCGPYPRGVPGMYGRPTLKVGPRSLQWKRESPSTPVGSAVGTPTAGTPLSTTPRRALRYVRSGSKPADGNSCLV